MSAGSHGGSGEDARKKAPRPWSRETELRVVEAHSFAHEAYLARMALEAAGFEAVVADDHVIALHWLWSNLLGGVRVMVRDADLAEAREFLGAVRAAAPALQESEGEPCPRCGSTTATAVYRRKRAAFAWLALTGFLLLPMPRRLRCAACGFDGKPMATARRAESAGDADSADGADDAAAGTTGA